MEANVCGIEKSLRILSGVILLLLYYLGYAAGNWGIAALVAGSYLMVTGLAGFCPINLLLKINTCKTKMKNKLNQTEHG